MKKENEINLDSLNTAAFIESKVDFNLNKKLNEKDLDKPTEDNNSDFIEISIIYTFIYPYRVFV